MKKLTGKTTRRGFLKGVGAATLSAMCPAVIELACSKPKEDPIILGVGRHRYEWLRDWARLPAGMEFGNTHGCVVPDSQGRILMNTDSEHSVVIFDLAGNYLDSWGVRLAGGLHGMTLVTENASDYLYLAHHKRREVIKAELDGQILWTFGYPVESGVYDSRENFRPTSVAVHSDGRLFVADGYGESWVHLYDPDRRYLRSIGGKGSEAGKMMTPHGLWIDTRAETSVLLVADRENHRLQIFSLEGEHLDIIEGELRRPCNMHQRDEDIVVADLAGRVTIFDKDFHLVTHLGDNPDPAKRAQNGVPREEWVNGQFISPHSACWDEHGDLYVTDWLAQGRISKLKRVT